MKRPRQLSPQLAVRLGEVKLNFTRDQLAGVGKVALTFNEIEARLLSLFGFTCGLSEPLRLAVYSRIGGLDGIVELIKLGAKQSGVDERVISELAEILGKGVFETLKQYRDAVVHARAYNAPAGIGLQFGKRAKVFEVLLDASSLEILADHLTCLNEQLKIAVWLFYFRRTANQLAADDPQKESYARSAEARCLRFLRYRNRRLSLRPLPEFPSESQVKEVQEQWLRQLSAPTG